MVDLVALVWHTEQRRVGDLVPWDRNPRQMTDKQVKDLTRSLERFGLMSIPVVNAGDNLLISGHQRCRIMISLGREDEIIDVRVSNRPLTQEEIAEANLRENRNLGEWDFDMLANFDIGLLKDVGFTTAELDTAFDLRGDREPKESAYDKIKTDIKRGDVFLLGDHRLMCGDSTSLEDVQRLMAGDKAQVVFTDPPYNVNYKSFAGGSYADGKYKHEAIINDNLSDGDCSAFFQAVLENLYVASEDSAAIYWWYAMRNELLNRKAFLTTGWHISQVIIWLKNGIVLAPGQDYHRCYETCYFGWKKGKKHFRITRKKEKEVWTMDEQTFESMLNVWLMDRDSTAEYIHPTQKPEGLAARALMRHSDRGHVVLDLFGGSGSTLMAAQTLERKARLMEMDPVYCQLIVNRWETATHQVARKEEAAESAVVG